MDVDLVGAVNVQTLVSRADTREGEDLRTFLPPVNQTVSRHPTKAGLKLVNP